MSYEFNNIISALAARGYTLSLEPESYGLDADDVVYDCDDCGGVTSHPSWDMSFDSRSTFDENDMDYQRSLMY